MLTSAADQSPDAALRIEARDRWLIVRFSEPHAALSWAIVGGGFTHTSVVAFHEVTDAELKPRVDPAELFRERLRGVGLTNVVGLLTSRCVGTFSEARAQEAGSQAHAVATVGLGNALRAGDPPGVAGRIGTINVLCRVSRALGECGLVEALALATEARALAVREGDVESRVSGLPASGTGTDCVVIAAPVRGSRARYAGKHTELGSVLGRAVFESVKAGIERWKAERAAGGKR